MALENIQKMEIQELNKEKARRQDNKQHCQKDIARYWQV